MKRLEIARTDPGQEAFGGRPIGDGELVVNYYESFAYSGFSGQKKLKKTYVESVMGGD